MFDHGGLLHRFLGERPLPLARALRPGWGPPDLLFGGPHRSQPSFRKAGVKEGDELYPVRLLDGTLYVLGRMRVKRLTRFELGGAGNPLDEHLQRYAEWRWLARTCTNEVIIGRDGTPLRLDAAVPPDLLERLTFRSRRRERTLKHVQDGRLLHSLPIQGIYRLSEPSAAELAALLTAPAVPSAPSRRLRRRSPPVTPGQQCLFR
jgi:hypothetical protein